MALVAKCTLVIAGMIYHVDATILYVKTDLEIVNAQMATCRNSSMTSAVDRTITLFPSKSVDQTIVPWPNTLQNAVPSQATDPILNRVRRHRRKPTMAGIRHCICVATYHGTPAC